MTLKPHTYGCMNGKTLCPLTFSIVDGNIRPTLIQLHDFVPCNNTEVRRHFLMGTILNIDSIITNTIISSWIIFNHRYNHNQARIPSLQQKESRSLNTLLILHLVRFCTFTRNQNHPRHTQKPSNVNENYLDNQQQTNKYQINKTNIIKATMYPI